MALTRRMEVIEYVGGDNGTEVGRHVAVAPPPDDGSALDHACRIAHGWQADPRATAAVDTWLVRVRAIDGSVGTARGTRGSQPVAHRLSLTPAFTFAEQAAALDPISALLGRLRSRISPEDPMVPAASRLIPELAHLVVAAEHTLISMSNGDFGEVQRLAKDLHRLGEQIAATATDIAAYR
ncbi:MAG TPA: hypothetical protein VF755_25275 [Catenuloplanes sp.]|jgi:hypothetical protein